MSTSLSVVRGNLITANVDCIVQQCNCLAVRPHGLAASIAEALPYANIYGQRRGIGARNLAQVSDRPAVGTCQLVKGGDDHKGPYVACLFGQYVYGKAEAYRVGDPQIEDTNAARETYFQLALTDFAKQVQQINANGVKIQRVAFPFLIGCGLAGGHWKHYERMIQEFAQAHKELNITLFRL